MTVLKVLTYIFAFTEVFVRGDFFSDLDKLDIDSKLRELDKAMKSIDDGDDSVLNKVKPKPQEDDPTLGSAVEMLADLFGGECRYQCKNGNKPVAKPGHIPTSNGCGSSEFKIDTADIPGAADCCHEHDYCYDTCNSDRTTCDKEFKECLHNTCKNTKSSNKKISYKDCRTTADLMYSGTAALGCDAFLKAQESACSCSKTVKNNKNKKSTPNTSQNAAKRDNNGKKSTRSNDEL